MLFRFVYTFIIGVIYMVAISFLGRIGMVALVPLAFMPIFRRKAKIHEDKYKLLHRTNSYVLGLMIIGLVVLDQLAHFSKKAVFFQNNWLGLAIAGFLILQGAIGYIIFKKN
jgi:heme A synthase